MAGPGSGSMAHIYMLAALSHLLKAPVLRQDHFMRRLRRDVQRWLVIPGHVHVTARSPRHTCAHNAVCNVQCPASRRTARSARLGLHTHTGVVFSGLKSCTWRAHGQGQRWHGTGKNRFKFASVDPKTKDPSRVRYYGAPRGIGIAACPLPYPRRAPVDPLLSHLPLGLCERPPRRRRGRDSRLAYMLRPVLVACGASDDASAAAALVWLCPLCATAYAVLGRRQHPRRGWLQRAVIEQAVTGCSCTGSMGHHLAPWPRQRWVKVAVQV